MQPSILPTLSPPHGRTITFDSSDVIVETAAEEDRRTIYRMRHDVYALELMQYPRREGQSLHDALDEVNTYLVARMGQRVVGFISITPPSPQGYSVDKYFQRECLSIPFDDGLYEMRLLTVEHEWRRSHIAALLMYAGFRWISNQGGKHVVALGRVGSTKALYEKVGFTSLGMRARSGETEYELMDAPMDRIRARVETMGRTVERLRRGCRWQLPFAFDEPAACFHGGASISAMAGHIFAGSRLPDIITADVLDAWFDPAPAVLKTLQDNLALLLRTSPPTDCRPLLDAISQNRGVPQECLVPGAGSSDLIFRAFKMWLGPSSRVLLLDPTYGEYSFVTEQIVGCHVERFTLAPENGFKVDFAAFRQRLSQGYDLVVIVNPNSPTGQFIPAPEMIDLLVSVPSNAIVWVDETYIDYCGRDASIEQWAWERPNVVICKSMSKVYALSGARAAYLVAAPSAARRLIGITPPWVVGFPSQLAAATAVAETTYYEGRYAETHRNRVRLVEALGSIDGVEHVIDGAANFLLCRLHPALGGAEKLVKRCRTQGLFLRTLNKMSARPDPHIFRTAVKDASTNERIEAIIRSSVAAS
jgi:histidinol-phosphate/aromatic aminotransferase/cobyric acid decarboxylase-like protein/predicted N-acetyltransferase YhbS